MPPAPQIEKYGLLWNAAKPALDIELEMIRYGGYFESGGVKYGKGLVDHYRAAKTLAWPDDDHHRWTDLILRRMIENDITVIMGSSDSGKSYGIASFVLIDWWAFPENTLWLLSSTELRGAELRIWGAIKQLFNRARERHPWLPGTVLESKHSITTEEISEDGSEARLLTKGLIFVPCFPAGTMVDTPSGQRPIESIQRGDTVIGACGAQTVKQATERIAKDLLRVTLSDGRVIDTTPEHKFLTSKGWCSAIALEPGDSVLSAHDTMRILREGFYSEKKKPKVLLSGVLHARSSKDVQVLREEIHPERQKDRHVFLSLLREIDCGYTGNAEKVLGVLENQRLGGAGAEGASNTDEQSAGDTAAQREDETAVGCIGEARNEAIHGDRNRPSENQIGGCSCGVVSRGDLQFLRSNRHVVKTGQATQILNRSGLANIEAGGGDRWKIPPAEHAAGQRRGAGRIFAPAKVDRVEILRRACDPRYNASEGGYRVYNLEVETHPSYSVNGVIVHNCRQGNQWVGLGPWIGVKPVRANGRDGRLGHVGDECQLMSDTFLSAYANWYGKPNFRGALTGNPTDMDDPLCQAGEPVDGWESWQDTGKTQEWKSKFYGAHVIALDGRDSPNNDHPNLIKPRYPYLVGKKKLEAVAKTHGVDSWQYFNQCIGKPRSQNNVKRVITRAVCEKGRVFDNVIWEGTDTTKVAFLDAAYGGVGGDRCMAGHLEFGRDVEGKSVIAFHPLVLVPVSVRNPDPPEDQIARFMMQYCNGFDIPPQNLFFDGRGSLAIALARIWSALVNVVDFGGKASTRPVSLEEYVFDGDNNTRRLKRCDEHYSKFVTELWFSVYYLAIGQQLRQFPREAASEGYKREWRYTTGNRIEVEPKDEMKKRTNQSPDCMDAVVAGIEGARRLGFVIENMRDDRDRNKPPEDANWLEIEAQRYRDLMRKQELRYDRS